MRKFISLGTIGFIFTSLLFSSDFSEEKMKIHEYFSEFFEKDARSMTDAQAYKILKKYPLAKDVNYLAVPWTYLMFYGGLESFPAIKLDSGFTLCQERYEKILPILKQVGIDVVFSPNVKKGMEYEGIKVLPFPFYAVNGVRPAEKKDILYSFIGFYSQTVRQKVFNLSKQKDAIIKRRRYWHYARETFRTGCNTKEQQKKEREEYQDILARSRFSLCPRGSNPATMRFWESLQAGAIPVLIGDSMALPEEFDWESCIVRVSEEGIHKIDQIIRSIPLDREKQMRARCLEAFALFSGKNLVSVIRHYYESTP